MGVAEKLSRFLKLASKNANLRQSHLSLYAAILVQQDQAADETLFRVSRRELMEHAAIRSFATYHRCLGDLITNGFIAYEPSYHPQLASRIRLLDR